MEPEKVVKVGAPVEVKGSGVRVQFQSDEAKEGSKSRPIVESAPAPAAVNVVNERVVYVSQEDYNELVLVNPKVTIPRTRIGDTWYSFAANKKCTVPKHVAQLLEEKGVV